MQYYLEVVFINNVLVSLLAFELSANFSLLNIAYTKFIKVLVLEQVCLLVALFIYEDAFLLTYIFYIFLFKRKYKRMFMYFSLRLVLVLLQFVFCRGNFYVGNYFVSFSFALSLIWCLFVFLYAILYVKWNAYIRVSDFIYDVRFSKGVRIKGYVDSANFATHNTLPVVFLKETYRDKIVYGIQDWMFVEGIHGVEKKAVYLAKIAINSHKEQLVYICFSKQLQLQYGCDCLLNVEM